MSVGVDMYCSVCHLFAIHRYYMIGCPLVSAVSRPGLPVDLTVINGSCCL